MACPASYTVVILPLRTSLSSLHALRFYLWVKQLKELEREKDSLWAGLDVLEQARLWYHARLESNRARLAHISTTEPEGLASCLQRSCMQRANGSMGSLMSDPNVTSNLPSLPCLGADSALRWQNTVLGQEVSEKNRKISVLELERDELLLQLEELHR